jgi:hypothetical protein
MKKLTMKNSLLSPNDAWEAVITTILLDVILSSTHTEFEQAEFNNCPLLELLEILTTVTPL